MRAACATRHLHPLTHPLAEARATALQSALALSAGKEEAAASAAHRAELAARRSAEELDSARATADMRQLELDRSAGAWAARVRVRWWQAAVRLAWRPYRAHSVRTLSQRIRPPAIRPDPSPHLRRAARAQ